MNNISEVLCKIQDKISEALNYRVLLNERGSNTYQITTQFTFADGDGFVVFLEISGDNIRFHDNGHTLMHASFEVDIDNMECRKVIKSILSTHNLSYLDGEISTEASISEIGAVFWNFMRGLIRVASYLNLMLPNSSLNIEPKFY